jgi:hypothetical protein
MADLARLAFRTSISVAVLGAAFGTGIYSAHKENGLFRTVYGAYDAVKTTVEEIPNLTRSRPVRFLRDARYPGSGVTVNQVSSDDLILLSGFIGDDQKVQLIERNGRVLASWRLLPRDMLPNPDQCRNPPQTNWNSPAHNTIIQPDGSIVLSFESCGMIKLDRCGKMLWATKEITHHSPNFLTNGGIVIAGGRHIRKQGPWPFLAPYWEDFVSKFDAQGRPVMEKAATTMFLENGMAPILTASTGFDPTVNGEFHLNEVEELTLELAKAFPMFEAGDLLVSFRNLNMIMVTDSSFGKVKWYKIGPWIRQHDPDWNSNGRITVFDNRPDWTEDGRVGGGSRIIEVDPATGRTATLYGDRQGQLFSTAERGLHQMQPDGSILITEAQAGRAFQVDRSGKVVWDYVNRYDDEQVTWLHGAEAWPRSFFKVSDWSCKAATAPAPRAS